MENNVIDGVIKIKAELQKIRTKALSQLDEEQLQRIEILKEVLKGNVEAVKILINN